MQARYYDPVIGRLMASTGPWGAGTFQYDGLGNIRRMDTLISQALKN
ncbi:MAG: hypothetical protein KKF36_04040 [Alphaproteobacteria bacterium]|nr:hypothetical protein [Alphaproteobacteria bacterium]